MAGPSYVTRSYGGGAVAAQLLENIGPTDTFFGITTTVGWTEESGAPLGTSGPFVVIIDRSSSTVEKILCSSVNLTTGIVTVYTSVGFSGRGYDGTNGQSHVPGGSVTGVQTTWSSLEAYEANKAVTYLLGDAGGTPSIGQVITWSGTAPEWAAASPLSGQPAGRIYQNTLQTLTSGITIGVTGCVQDFVKGGVTTSVSGAGMITVPVTGIYHVSAQVSYSLTSFTVGSFGARFLAIVTGALEGEQDLSPGVVSGTPSPTISSAVALTAGTTLTLEAYQATGVNVNTVPSTALTFLSVSLVSQ